MAARATGFGMLASNSVQEVMDMALIAQAATLEARIPFLHFFDGFRTSHEVAKVEQLTHDDLRAMIDDEPGARAPRARPLARPSRHPRHGAEPRRLLPGARSRATRITWPAPTSCRTPWTSSPTSSGRQYHLFDYVGAPDAERVIMMMGSGAEVAQETVEPSLAAGEKVGLLKVRLYRPFAIENFVAALPDYREILAVLDRTKEPGATGEPLYCDVITALAEMGRCETR